MSYIITNTTTTISGNEVETQLYQDKENSGELMFLQDFQSRHAFDLDFQTHREILNFLDFEQEYKMIIANDELYYPAIVGSRQLQFYGTITEV